VRFGSDDGIERLFTKVTMVRAKITPTAAALHRFPLAKVTKVTPASDFRRNVQLVHFDGPRSALAHARTRVEGTTFTTSAAFAHVRHAGLDPIKALPLMGTLDPAPAFFSTVREQAGPGSRPG
jgi:hypothetical protein